MKARAYGFFMLALILSCNGKKSETESSPETIEVDSARDFYKQSEIDYDYARFQGIYDNESKTSTFSAVLSVTENGDDLSIELSVSQADGCKGELSGTVFMVGHDVNYYTGFHQHDTCKLQFSFMLTEEKIDIKEIGICTLHESSCSFDGTYVKRKPN
jgi:hypothetical protein